VLQLARATETRVAVHFGPSHLSLSVQDNGRGFQVPEPPDVLAHKGHFGLMGLQERALLCGGQLSIPSEPDGGTEISARLPYPDSTGKSPLFSFESQSRFSC
jgi:signal transduction histidine kinase